jgi:tRNA(His) 5'-end guanylyltransferase
MRFDDLDTKMRRYETAHDRAVPAGVHIVARIDGRSFTRLTKETHAFEVPFDARVRDLMVATTAHLMECGLRAIYGYTQSDEISVLFHRDETSFGRKTRKLATILAGEASAAFALGLGAHAAFDARVCELPDVEAVRDYFRWRAEDARRNALSAHCYWALRKDGASVAEATARFSGASIDEKRAFLAGRGVDFDALPAWQRRGTGLVWASYEREAVDPRSGQPVVTTRRQVRVDGELPEGDAYGAWIVRLVEASLA